MLIEIKVPVFAESISEGSLLAWKKQEGEFVAADEVLVEIETDKVVMEVSAPQPGRLERILKQEGDMVAGEEVIAQLNTRFVEETGTKQDASGDAPKTSPSVRKLAAEQGVNLTQVPHQGDRVTKEDILRYQQAHVTEPVPESPPAAAQRQSIAPVAAHDDNGRPEQRVPMTRLRKRIAQRLLAAQQEHAILTTFNEVNMGPVMALRKKYKDAFLKTHDARLGFMSFFTQAVVAGLKKYPLINASSAGDDIIYHGYYDIGIAVSSPRGLVVPVIRNADRLSMAEIESAIADFGKRARDNKLNIEDLQGGTFSITNGGIFGSMLSTPLLNPPQSAILGMHNIVERPWVEDGQIVIRPIMYVALSYDHRLIDGREAVSFLFTVKQLLEDPARLLLDV